MQQILIAKLHEYLIQNNADLIISPQAENKVSSCLKDKVDSVGPLVDGLLAENTPAYIIEERFCMNQVAVQVFYNRASKGFSRRVKILKISYGQ